MEEQEQKLIQEIRELFEELVKEEKGRYAPGTNYRVILPPNSSTYYYNAKKLIEKALQLSRIDQKYDASLLDEILRDEVSAVGRHHYEYKCGTNSPTTESVNELVRLMHDATYHIKLYSYEVLGDIDINR